MKSLIIIAVICAVAYALPPSSERRNQNSGRMPQESEREYELKDLTENGVKEANMDRDKYSIGEEYRSDRGAPAAERSYQYVPLDDPLVIFEDSMTRDEDRDEARNVPLEDPFVTFEDSMARDGIPNEIEREAMTNSDEARTGQEARNVPLEDKDRTEADETARNSDRGGVYPCAREGIPNAEEGDLDRECHT